MHLTELTCPAEGDLHDVGEGEENLGASPEALPLEMEPRRLRMAGRSGTAPPCGRP